MHASHQLVSTVRGGADPEGRRQADYPQDAVKKDQAGRTHQEPRRKNLINN